MSDKNQSLGRILFVYDNMTLSDSSIALVNLLELLSKKGVRTDLFLFEHRGALLDRVKRCANLLPEDVATLGAFCQKTRAAENFMTMLQKGIFSIKSLFVGRKKALLSLYKKTARLLLDYDTVIAFAEREITDFVAQIPTKNRVAFVHNNFGKIIAGYDLKDFERTYAMYKHVLCASETSLKSMLPHIKNPNTCTHVIREFVNEPFIAKMCEQMPYHLPEFVSDDTIKFVSIGRFSEKKKFDRIIKAATKLKSEGIKFCWILVGGGEQFENIRAQRDAAQLRGEVILTGIMESPYPVMAISDCVVISSGYEVNSTVALEALAMHKPVISTDFEYSREVISDGVNGLICENSAEGLTASVEALLTCPDLFEKIKAGATEYDPKTEETISALLDIIC